MLPALYAGLQAPARRIYREEAAGYLQLAAAPAEGLTRLLSPARMQLLYSSLQVQQIELGQRVRRVRLRHPEIWPRYMTSTHGNLLDKTRWCDYTINRRGADCKGQLSIPH